MASMFKRLLLVAVMLLPLAVTACRIGSGFDSEGRLAAQPQQTVANAETPENKGPANPDTANRTDAASLPAPVVFLIPAG